jgi:transcriptional regulator with XRE-family HTH domain
MLMTSFSEKLKTRMEQLDLTQEALAKLVGITRGQVGHYLKDRRSPPLETLYRIADAISVNPKDLVGDDMPAHYEAAVQSPDSKTFPFLRVSEIDEWLYNAVIKKHYRIVQMSIMDKNIGAKAFVFEVVGSAMVNPNNSEKSLNPGEQVLVEPETIPKSGQFVLVKFGKDDIRIRQYQEDGAMKFLKAFEPHLPIEPLKDPYIILGTIKIAVSLRNVE